MSKKAPKFETAAIPPNVNVAIVAAKFNQKIVDVLLEGCVQRLAELGVDGARVAVHRVPGAFEIPLAAKALAHTKRYSAVICLGAVIRGETAHFEHVAGECARGIAQVSLSEMTPVIFGVLTTNNEQQAWDRAGGKHSHAGKQAAEAAVEMIALLRQVHEG